MPRGLWPERASELTPLFDDVFRGALSAIGGYQIEDRFGVYFRSFHYQYNNTVVERVGWRQLPLSGLSGWELLFRYAQDELARVHERITPPNLLIISVLSGPHPRGATVPPDEERAIFKELGIPVPNRKA